MFILSYFAFISVFTFCNLSPLERTLFMKHFFYCFTDISFSATCFPLTFFPGGRGALRYRGGGGAHSLRISRKKGSFLRPPHVLDFVKEGYFFVPRYEVWGSKSPYNPRNIRDSDAERLPK